MDGVHFFISTLKISKYLTTKNNQIIVSLLQGVGGGLTKVCYIFHFLSFCTFPYCKSSKSTWQYFCGQVSGHMWKCAEQESPVFVAVFISRICGFQIVALTRCSHFQLSGQGYSYSDNRDRRA